VGRAASTEHIPKGWEEDSEGDWESEAEITMEDTPYRYQEEASLCHCLSGT